jgi:hypothetical protein
VEGAVIDWPRRGLRPQIPLRPPRRGHLFRIDADTAHRSLTAPVYLNLDRQAQRFFDPLVLCRSFTISAVRAVVGYDAAIRIFLGTPRQACTRVLRAPRVGHVVQTRTGTGCQQGDKHREYGDSHGENDD